MYQSFEGLNVLYKRSKNLRIRKVNMYKLDLYCATVPSLWIWFASFHHENHWFFLRGYLCKHNLLHLRYFYLYRWHTLRWHLFSVWNLYCNIDHTRKENKLYNAIFFGERKIASNILFVLVTAFAANWIQM
jgi:hypothetical protein